MLKHYKEQQHESQTLINRLNMFRMHEIRIESKFQTVDKQTEKLRQIKQDYLEGKMQMSGVVG